MDVVKLVNKAKKGNKKALVKLIMAERDAYYRLAFTYMKNEQDALDAISEMTVIMYEKIHQLQNPEAFYRWSKTILVNECKALLKNKQKVIYVEEYLAVNGEKLSNEERDYFANRDRYMDIDVMLAILNAEQKEAIQLKYFHDLDYKTIAQIMNISVGTVKSRIHYGMKQLQERFGSEKDEKN